MGYFSDLDIENKEKPDESFEEGLYNKGKERGELEGKLFVYNYQYRSLDGFEKKLGELLFHADLGNQRRMLNAFPEHTQAVMDYQSKEGWWDDCIKDVEDYRASFK